jgi:hypothetical protein
MAINPTILSAKGFNGVSCKRGAPLSKAALSFNVDTSKGTIRPRDGFVTVKRFYPSVTSGSPSKAIAVRVLGVKSFLTSNGDSLILVIMWDENTYKLLMAVIDQQGAVIDSSMPFSISDFPYSVKPGPYMFPVFQTMGPRVYMSFPSGQVFYYSHSENPNKLMTPEVGASVFRSETFGYLEEVPQASVITEFMGSMVYAGFDGEEQTAYSFDLPQEQTDVPEFLVNVGRGSVTEARGTIYMSDAGMPEAVPSATYQTLGTGEKITALHGIGSTLYAFTNQSIFVGSFDAGKQSVGLMGKAVSGVGCVSQRTVVEGKGLTAFLSVDGVYALSGGSVVKISSDIDDMFTEDGWEIAPIYNMSQTKMINVKYPFKILHSQLKFACGGYDQVRNLMWWSVPVAGTHVDEVYTNQYQNGSVDEIIARVCIVYDPGRQSWNIWGSTDNTTFIPTCFDMTFDNGRPRFLFGDEFSGVNAYGEDVADRVSSDDGGRLFDSGTPFTWFWQSQPFELGPSTVGSVRSLRVKQKARGGNFTVSQKTNWFLESEFSFDEPNGELSFTGTISGNPSELYPKEKAANHIWGTSVTSSSSGSSWGSVRFHKGSTWKAKYSVNNNIVGRSFSVGFSGLQVTDRGQREDIYDFDLEIQPKRDVT